MSIARKKRISEQCLIQTKAEKEQNAKKVTGDSGGFEHELNVVSRNWAMVGFFDATSTYDTIRKERQVTVPTRTILSNVDQMSSHCNIQHQRLSRQLSSGDFSYGDVAVGDVYEEVRTLRVKHGPLHLYTVVEIYPHSKSALVESVFGKEKKKWAELLDELNYRLILTQADHDKGSRKQKSFRPLPSMRDPLLEDRAKYSGEEGKIGLYTLFRHTPMETPPVLHAQLRRSSGNDSISAQHLRELRQGDGPAHTASQSDSYTVPPSVPEVTVAPVSKLTPRLAYVRACQKDALPPIPLISRCFDDSYPVLDLSGQSVGSRFCVALAEALPNMHFLREVNFSSNRLDHRSAPVVIDSLAASTIESVILDENKIGKPGIQSLISLINGFGTLANSGGQLSGSGSALALPTSSFSGLPPLNFATLMNTSGKRNPMLPTTAPTATAFRLVKLSLNGNDIGDTLISKLVRCLSVNGSSLTRLGLRSNKCSTFTAQAVHQMLTAPTCELQYLDLSWNELQSKGGLLVLRALKSNRSLQDIQLDWNGIGMDAVPLLKEVAASDTSKLMLMTLLQNHIPDTVLVQIEASVPSKRLRFNCDEQNDILWGG